MTEVLPFFLTTQYGTISLYGQPGRRGALTWFSAVMRIAITASRCIPSCLSSPPPQTKSSLSSPLISQMSIPVSAPSIASRTPDSTYLAPGFKDELPRSHECRSYCGARIHFALELTDGLLAYISYGSINWYDMALLPFCPQALCPTCDSMMPRRVNNHVENYEENATDEGDLLLIRKIIFAARGFQQMVGLKLSQTPPRLYAYLLHKTRLLPVEAQPYYRNYIKQNFRQHADEDDPGSIKIMISTAISDMDWLLAK
ncbi:LYR motif-containing protein 9, partial [Taenia solium]